MKFKAHLHRIPRLAGALALLCASASPAPAFEIVHSPLPAFASGDAGLSFATGAVAVHDALAFSPLGPFGLTGALPRTGYDLKFDNLTLGVRSAAGYFALPYSGGLWGGAPSGFDVSSTSVRFGYDLGRLKPYMAVDTLAMRPGFASPGAAFNSPLTTQNERSAARLSAGFNYAVTNNFSVGVGVSVGATQGFGSPLIAPGLR